MATERESFEAWIKEHGGDLSTFGSGQNTHYRNSAVNNAWVAWSRRAALASAPAAEPVAWTPGPNVFKDWCSQWFGPDADDDYLAKAVFALPPVAQRFSEPAQPAPQAGAAEFDYAAVEEHRQRMRKQVREDAGYPTKQPSQAAAEPTDEALLRIYKQTIGYEVAHSNHRAIEVMRAARAAHPTEQPSQDAEVLAKIRTAITGYHLVLDRRDHGGVAAANAFAAIQEAMGMPWVQGAAARAAQAQGESTGGTPHG